MQKYYLMLVKLSFFCRFKYKKLEQMECFRDRLLVTKSWMIIGSLLSRLSFGQHCINFFLFLLNRTQFLVQFLLHFCAILSFDIVFLPFYIIVGTSSCFGCCNIRTSQLLRLIKYFSSDLWKVSHKVHLLHSCLDTFNICVCRWDYSHPLNDILTKARLF